MHPAIKGIIFRQDNLSKQTGGEIIFPKFGADDPKNRLFSRRNDQITHFRRTRRDFCRVRLLFVLPVVLLAGLFFSTAYLVDATYNPFLYFRF